jgi:hypothetical protein
VGVEPIRGIDQVERLVRHPDRVRRDGVGQPDRGEVCVADGPGSLDASLPDADVEAGRDVVEHAPQDLGARSLGELRELQDVGEQDRHLGIALGDESVDPGGVGLGAFLQALGDGTGQQAAQEPLRDLLLLLDPLVEDPRLLVQEANLEQVVDPEQHLGEVEGLADEIPRPGPQRA